MIRPSTRSRCLPAILFAIVYTGCDDTEPKPGGPPGVSPTADSGAPRADAGTPSADAAPTHPDATVPPIPDAGVRTYLDAGSPVSCFPAACQARDVVAAADWDNAERIILNMVEEPLRYAFDPEDVTVTAGRPYIMVVKNPGTNDEHHNWETPQFYRAIALRKMVTTNAEYFAPYISRLEIETGAELEIHFVPIVPGHYEVECTFPDHVELGMVGTVTIEGDPGLLDLEIDPAFDVALETDDRRSKRHDVWRDGTQVDVQFVETSTTEFRISPANIPLTLGQGYTIGLSSAASNTVPHTFDVSDLFVRSVTRQIGDETAKVLLPYVRSVRVLPGGIVDLLMVPTQAGTFDVRCTEPGHSGAGETGQLVVQ